MTSATYPRDMLESHPSPIAVDGDLLAQCIAACAECDQGCTACADACLSEDGLQGLRRCIRINLDCADVCATTGRMLTRQTQHDVPLSRAQLAACREACAACAEECARHAEAHEHCRVCAEACRRCEALCTELAAALI